MKTDQPQTEPDLVGYAKSDNLFGNLTLDATAGVVFFAVISGYPICSSRWNTGVDPSLIESVFVIELINLELRANALRGFIDAVQLSEDGWAAFVRKTPI